MSKHEPQGAIRAIASPATRLVAVCGKCGRKLGGGFGKGGDTSLPKLLRRDLINAKGKRAAVRIVETKCLDICPKGAVVVVDGGAPGQPMIVPGGTAAGVVAQMLGLPLAQVPDAGEVLDIVIPA